MRYGSMLEARQAEHCMREGQRPLVLLVVTHDTNGIEFNLS